MLTFLVLGFLIGLRHALEPDHVAAVLSITTRGGTLRDHARAGMWWGIGHALTLLLLAGGCLLFGVRIPESMAALLEAGVGVMLVWLGVSVFVRRRRSGVHFHVHQHPGGLWHYHAHPHAEGMPHGEDAHEHRHERRPLVTLTVGMVHGLAGSGALLLLACSADGTPTLRIAYIALFGLGAILGMIVLATTVAVPLRRSAHHRTAVWRGFCALVGSASILIGSILVWDYLATGR